MSTIQSSILAFTYASLDGLQSNKKSEENSGFAELLKAGSTTEAKPKKCEDCNDGGASLARSIQQFVANISLSLLDIGDTKSRQTSTSISGTSFGNDGGISVDALLNQGGPLPEFLNRVGVQYNLNDAQKQSLREVAIQFKDTDGSPASVQKMAEALSKAGITAA